MEQSHILENLSFKWLEENYTMIIKKNLEKILKEVSKQKNK